jgi:hypothetical protein
MHLIWKNHWAWKRWAEDKEERCAVQAQENNAYKLEEDAV